MTVVLHALEALEGGTARHVTDVVRHVEGVTHHVALPPRRVGGGTDEQARPAMEEAGATVHLLPMRRLPVAPANAVALVALRRLAARLRPDVIHGHSSIGGALARMAVGTDTWRVYTPNGLHPSAAAAWLEGRLGRRTDRLVAASPSEARIAAARGIVPTERIVTIANGIDLTGAPAGWPDGLRADLGVDAGAPLVGFVGRLVPQKAPLDFVDMAARIHAERPPVRFVMIGGGPLEGRVAAAVSAGGLDGIVHLVRHRPGAAAVMDELDALVLPSRYEGGPYAPLEAMRAGTPVVVSDAVGNRDVVADRESGLVVRVGDVDALAGAVVELLSDPALARRLAGAARRRLADRFDVRAMAESLSRLYDEGARQRARR